MSVFILQDISVLLSVMKNYTTTHRRQIVKYAKPIVIVLALCATVLLFSPPAVSYYIIKYSNDHTDDFTTTGGGETLVINQSNKISCDDVSWVNITTDDTTAIGESPAHHTICEPYLGRICLPYLTQWQQCLTTLTASTAGGDLNVAIDTKQTQDIREQDIAQIQQLLASSIECREVAIPFLCHYHFPLMADANCQSHWRYSVTQDDCTHIASTVCSSQWQLAIVSGYGDRLPDCSSLPHKNGSLADSAGDLSSGDGIFPIAAGVNTFPSNITCQDGFILINKMCFPRCDRFEQHSHDKVLAVQITQAFVAAFKLSLCVFAFILSIINRKLMFKFPNFFLLLFVLDVAIADVIILIVSVDRTGLLCSSVNLIESFNNPTTFCTISGAVFHYVFINLAVWWFIHTGIFFYEIMFPFHAIRLKRLEKTRQLSAVLIIIGLLIPIPGVIVALCHEEDQYRIMTAPPETCLPSARMWFYSVIVVDTILVGTGVCFLITIFWHINRQFSTAKCPSQQSIPRLSTAEKKIMLVSVSKVILAGYILAYFGVINGVSKKLDEGFASYFLCESTGHVPDKCNRREFERYVFPEMTVAVYTLMLLIPITVLNFLINWQKVWGSVKAWLIVVRMQITDVASKIFSNSTNEVEEKLRHNTSNITIISHV